MAEPSPTANVFVEFQTYLTEVHDIREGILVVVRDLEQKAREIMTGLQVVHQPDGIKQIPTVCKNAREKFGDIRKGCEELANKIQANQFYRFHDLWRFVTQRLCFLAAMIIYLESETLISKQQAADFLGVKTKRDEGFHLELDDFLMGLLQLASELSRLAVNAVTSGDYGRPLRIAKFVGELDSGFCLLNLKNDSLRKRFDGLKYDLKKVEEVVYNVTIRGLHRRQETAGDTPDTT